MIRFVRNNPRTAIGMKLALALLAPTKAHAALTGGNSNVGSNLSGMVASSAIRKLLSDELTRELREKIEKIDWVSEASVEAPTSSTVNIALLPAVAKNTAAAPIGASFQDRGSSCGVYLSAEQARLWLQCYNAGPYATLRYRGNVPYRETRGYTPKVRRYYQQNLANTPYDALIQKSAAKYGLDPQLVRAVMKTESDFRNRTCSSAGARGLMQVMPCVWSEVKKRYNLKWEYSAGVWEPEKNIEVACAYLAWLRYDFLPKNFEAFELVPEAPPALKRDRIAMKPARIITVAAGAEPARSPSAARPGKRQQAAMQHLARELAVAVRSGNSVLKKAIGIELKAATAMVVADSGSTAKSVNGPRSFTSKRRGASMSRTTKRAASREVEAVDAHYVPLHQDDSGYVYAANYSYTGTDHSGAATQ